MLRNNNNYIINTRQKELDNWDRTGCSSFFLLKIKKMIEEKSYIFDNITKLIVI